MTRTDIIIKLIKKHNYKSYLEIGVQNGKNFHAIECEDKIGVDPDPNSKATVHITSDEFFKGIAITKKMFDIIFIDGLHHWEQVFEDIDNSLMHLNKGGVIVCHDMNPTTEQMQLVPRIQTEWTGDCWKAWVMYRNSGLKMVVIDTDYGVGIIHRGNEPTLSVPAVELTYENLVANRKEWLNLAPVTEIDQYI